MKYLFCLTFLVCVSGVAAQKFRTHKNAEHGFEISYPKSWRASFQGKKSEIKFFAGHERHHRIASNVSLQISEKCPQTNLDSVAYHHMKHMRQHGHQIHGGNIEVLNGKTFYEFTSTLNTDIESSKTQYFLTINNGSVYMLRFFVYKEKEYDEFKDLHLKIAQSLKI